MAAKSSRYAACLAEKLGILIRPKACQWCRSRYSPYRLERHHPWILEPLNVIYLCRSCHKIADGFTDDADGESESGPLAETG
jgi:hypothetical protein